MVQIVYVSAAGERREVDAAEGENLMRVAIENGVEGIDAMCGGAASCATCQVYVDPAWVERPPAPEELESTMLELAEYRRETSRLSCQIKVTPDLAGLIVEVPEAQT